MKKFRFAILFMALSSTVMAQDIRYGITAGPTWSTMKTNWAMDQESKHVLGFHFGGFAEMPLAEKFSLRPELEYQTMGVKYPADDANDTFGVRTKSTYITLPILLEYALMDKLKVGVGPYASMMLSLKDKVIPYQGMEDEYNYDYVDESSHFKKLHLGVGAGISYQIVSKIGVNFRYNLGLSNMLKDGDTDSTVRNRSFSLGVSYSIR